VSAEGGGAEEREHLQSRVTRLEKRISDLEAENRKLRESLTNAFVFINQISQGPRIISRVGAAEKSSGGETPASAAASSAEGR
jgi:hypothetical protein